MKLNYTKEKKSMQGNLINTTSDNSLDNSNCLDAKIEIRDKETNIPFKTDEQTTIVNANNGKNDEYIVQDNAFKNIVNEQTEMNKPNEILNSKEDNDFATVFSGNTSEDIISDVQNVQNNKYSNISRDDKYDVQNNKYFDTEMTCDEYMYMHARYPENDLKYEYITFNPNMMYKIPKNRPVRIYCDGIYDLFHYGHARQLFQAKNLFPNVHLIVGICSDALTHKLKGVTVMKDFERYESAKHCRHVDEVIEDAPWVINNEFLKKHRIDFVAHDDIPYVGVGMDDLYSHLKKQQKFIPTKRTIGISTTSIITRLISDYDIFLRKQILRGISNEELNISVFKEKKIRIAKKFENEIEEIKTNWQRKKGEISREIAFIKDKFTGLQNSISEKQEKIKINFDEMKNELILILRWWERTSNEWFKAFVNQFEPVTNVSWFEAIVGFMKGNNKQDPIKEKVY